MHSKICYDYLGAITEKKKCRKLDGNVLDDETHMKRGRVVVSIVIYLMLRDVTYTPYFNYEYSGFLLTFLF